MFGAIRPCLCSLLLFDGSQTRGRSCTPRRLGLALFCGSLEPVTIEDLGYCGSSFQFPNLDFLYSNSCFIHTNQPFTSAIKLLVLLTKTLVWLIQKALIVSKLLTW